MPALGLGEIKLFPIISNGLRAGRFNAYGREVMITLCRFKKSLNNSVSSVPEVFRSPDTSSRPSSIHKVLSSVWLHMVFHSAGIRRSFSLCMEEYSSCRNSLRFYFPFSFRRGIKSSRSKSSPHVWPWRKSWTILLHKVVFPTPARPRIKIRLAGPW